METSAHRVCFAPRHDFVVVETIDFFDDEDSELPLPMTQRDVILLNRSGAFEEEDAEAKKDGGDDMEASDLLLSQELLRRGGCCAASSDNSWIECLSGQKWGMSPCRWMTRRKQCWPRRTLLRLHPLNRPQ